MSSNQGKARSSSSSFENQNSFDSPTVTKSNEELSSLEHHYDNIGVAVTEDKRLKEFKLCWCRLSELFKTQDIIESTTTFGQEKVSYFRPALIASGSRVNVLLTQFLGKEILGPVYFLFEKRDTNSKEILDYLMMGKK